MIKINLLPYRAARKKEIIARQFVLAALPLIVTCLVIGFFWWSLEADITRTQNDINVVREKIKQSKLKMKDIETFKEQKEMLKKKMDIIVALQNNKTGPVRMLDTIATCLPGNVWLLSLSQKGTELKLTGQSLDNVSVSRYMELLEKSETLSDIVLGEVKTESKTIGSSGAYLKKFFMTSRISYTGETTGPSS